MARAEFQEYIVYAKCYTWRANALFLITDRVRLHEAYDSVLNFVEPSVIRFAILDQDNGRVIGYIDCQVGWVDFIIYEF